jgi:hypothetical protein
MLEFSASFRVGQFVKDWRCQINAVSDAYRAAMETEQGPNPGIVSGCTRKGFFHWVRDPA